MNEPEYKIVFSSRARDRIRAPSNCVTNPSSHDASQRKTSSKNSKNSQSPNTRPISSSRKSSACKINKSKTKQSKVVKKADPNMYIKTSSGFKKKLIVKSTIFTHKNSEKESSNDNSENFEKCTTYTKAVSTPIGLFGENKFDRHIHIPIRKSNLDDSVSDGSENVYTEVKSPETAPSKISKNIKEGLTGCGSPNIKVHERIIFSNLKKPVFEASPNYVSTKDHFRSVTNDSTAPSNDSNKTPFILKPKNAV